MEVLVSAYGIAHVGSGYINAILTGGSSNLDIERRIDLIGSTRTENGSTNARHGAVEIGGGFAWGGENFRHGPFVSLTWQEVKVDGYSEDSLDSTAIVPSKHSRSASRL